jgi:hypothetical protein
MAATRLDEFAINVPMVSTEPTEMLNKQDRKRFCVITPYFKERRDLIEHCIESVARQIVKVDHILVADGFPQNWLDSVSIRHIKLDRSHSDYGNCARGIAAMMAVAEKYDGIAFLDADNWIDDDHISTCLGAANEHPSAAYVIAQRHFVRPDGSVMASVTPADVPYAEHVDTNCYLFLPPSFHLLHYWCTIPQELSTHGDMLFRYVLTRYIPLAPAITSKRTVKYLCMFGGIYLQIGEEPPVGAKPFIDWKKCTDWLNTLSKQELVLVNQLSGLELSSLTSKVS